MTQYGLGASLMKNRPSVGLGLSASVLQSSTCSRILASGTHHFADLPFVCSAHTHTHTHTQILKNCANSHAARQRGDGVCYAAAPGLLACKGHT